MALLSIQTQSDPPSSAGNDTSKEAEAKGHYSYDVEPDKSSEQKIERQVMIEWLKTRVMKNVREGIEYDLQKDESVENKVGVEGSERSGWRRFVGAVTDGFLGRVVRR